MAPPNPKKRGIWQNSRTHGGGPPSDANLVDRVADFSYESDALAQLIIEMWLGNHGNLLQAPAATNYGARSANAKAVLATRGIFLQEPIVVTETEYDNGFSLADAGLTKGVVLVLPDGNLATGSGTAGGPYLLETAKMLMAVTPNGI
jgi:hypothetical protein